MDPRTPFAVALLVASAAVAPVPVAAQDDPTIDRTTTLSLTPDAPGEIGVTVRFDLPERVTSLSLRLPPDAGDVRLDGFERDGDAFEWTGETASPTVRFALPANETTTGRRGNYSHEDGRFAFVDVGDWAIVATPSLATRWSWRGDDVEVSRETTVDGRGVVGDSMAYLGPVEVHERTVHGQRLRLAVPGAATMTERPADVLDALAAASGALRVGDRDERTLLIAAPTDVAWAARGLQYGDDAAWVLADEPLDTPESTWIHEYVHTRQSFRTTEATRWLTEATAEYYAALFAFEQGRIGYDAFARHLALGSRAPYADAVLNRPSTWSLGTDYYKGPLVAGAVDRQIRLETDGNRTFGDVLDRLNGYEEPVTGAQFLDAVETAGGSEVRDYATRYVATSAAPSMWSAAAHERAFGMNPARIDYLFAGEGSSALTVRGPYRNRTVSANAPLVVGENVTFPLTVSNGGGEAGDYEAVLAANGTALVTRSGSLAAGATTTLAVSHEFSEPGEYAVTLGDERLTVTVVEPGEATVDELSAPSGAVEPGATVTVTATVTAGDVPSRATLPVTVDGEAVGDRTVYLDAGASRRVNVSVTFDEVGTHEVSVGGQSVTVTVGDASATTRAGTGGAGTDPGRTPSTPGFGPAAAVAAIALAALARRL